jgi:UDP-GlcNAc:undecaprenyl-phosphate/decaprenyl-phosphate GlcNAc-1-phosphate transferase
LVLIFKDYILIPGFLVLSYFLIYIYNIYFLKNNLIDKVNDRSSHVSVATRSGGIAVFCSIFIISFLFYLMGNEIYDFSIIVSLSLLTVVGLYDDIYKMDFKLKFIFQIIAAKILIDNGLIIDNLHGVLGIDELSRIVAQLITIFIIVAIVNAINFVDGIDGLAASIVIIFVCSFEFFSSQISPYLNFSALIILSLIPLLYFNFKKENKVFLGDSGSLFLGGVVSIYTVFIMSNNYIIKPQFDLHKILFFISILIYPVTDITRIFFMRILKGKSPFIADKNHIHHLVFNKLKNHFKTTCFILLSSIIFIFLIQIIF